MDFRFLTTLEALLSRVLLQISCLIWHTPGLCLSLAFFFVAHLHTYCWNLDSVFGQAILFFCVSKLELSKRPPQKVLRLQKADRDGQRIPLLRLRTDGFGQRSLQNEPIAEEGKATSSTRTAQSQTKYARGRPTNLISQQTTSYPTHQNPS